MGENFVPAKQGWKELHELGVIKISQPTGRCQVKSKCGNQQNWSYDKSTRLTVREWVRDCFHRLRSCGSTYASKKTPCQDVTHLLFDELSSLWVFREEQWSVLTRKTLTEVHQDAKWCLVWGCMQMTGVVSRLQDFCYDVTTHYTHTVCRLSWGRTQGSTK